MSTKQRVIRGQKIGSLLLVSDQTQKQARVNTMLASYYCTYAKMWVRVKTVYDLTINSAEKTALTSMLNAC